MTWVKDGHVLVLTEGGRVRVECPGKSCISPFVACDTCEGQGVLYDDEGEEVDCGDCRSTGYLDGVRECWISSSACDIWSGLHDGEPGVDWEHEPPGRWLIEYQIDSYADYYDEFVKLIRRMPQDEYSVNEVTS